ncbi:hypothetical protein [Stappia sp.]
MHRLLIPPVLWLILLLAMAGLSVVAPVATLFDAPAEIPGWIAIAAGLAL